MKTVKYVSIVITVLLTIMIAYPFESMAISNSEKTKKIIPVFCCEKGKIVRDKMTRSELLRNANCSTSQSDVKSFCGVCCTNGKTSPVSSNMEKNNCLQKRGKFYTRLGDCKPDNVYCCIKGKIKKTTPAECKKYRGKAYKTASEAKKHCRSVDVFCCIKGKVKKTTPAECKKYGRKAYKTASEAKKHCRPVDVFCCIKEKIKKTTPAECKKYRRKAYKTASEAKKHCRPVDVFCCIKGKVKKTTPAECRKNKAKGYKTAAEAKRQCKAAYVYCCIDGKVKKTSLQECRKYNAKACKTPTEAKRKCTGKKNIFKRDGNKTLKDGATLNNKLLLGKGPEIPLPDLEIVAVRYRTNRHFTQWIEVEVRNNGPANIGISGHPPIQVTARGPYTSSTTFSAIHPITNLWTGATTPVRISLPGSITKPEAWTVKVDSGNVIRETDETNNSSTTLIGDGTEVNLPVGMKTKRLDRPRGGSKPLPRKEMSSRINNAITRLDRNLQIKGDSDPEGSFWPIQILSPSGGSIFQAGDTIRGRYRIVISSQYEETLERAGIETAGSGQLCFQLRAGWDPRIDSYAETCVDYRVPTKKTGIGADLPRSIVGLFTITIPEDMRHSSNYKILGAHSDSRSFLGSSGPFTIQPNIEPRKGTFKQQDNTVGARRMISGADSGRKIMPNRTVAGHGAEYRGDGGSLADLPIKMPEKTLRDPQNGPQNPGRFRSDLKEPLKTPLPGVDFGKIPERGDPAGDDDLVHVEGYDGEKDYLVTTTPDQGLDYSIIRAAYNNDNCLDDGTAHKILDWGSDNGPLGEFGNSDNDSDAGASSPLLNDGDDDDDMDETIDEGVNDGDEVAVDGDDPNPEGDDPDELRSSAMLGGRLPKRNATEGITIPGEKSGDDQWLRHKMEIQGKGGVDPEGEGGPDENINKDRLDHERLSSGIIASPSDGGQDDPDDPTPPGPAFSGSFDQSKTLSGETHMKDTGVSMSPTPEPDGPDEPQPGPEF